MIAVIINIAASQEVNTKIMKKVYIFQRQIEKLCGNYIYIHTYNHQRWHILLIAISIETDGFLSRWMVWMTMQPE